MGLPDQGVGDSGVHCRRELAVVNQESRERRLGPVHHCRALTLRCSGGYTVAQALPLP